MRSDIFIPFATYPDATGVAIAEPAMAVAKLLGRRIHALALELTIPDVSNFLSDILLDLPEMIRTAEATSRAHGTEVLAAFGTAALAAGINLDTQKVESAPAAFGDTAAELARYHDLVLVFCHDETARMLAEGVVFGSGRPVLLLPQGKRLDAVPHVAVAWDGSSVAARALADALPFLSMTSGITVLTVTDEKPLAGADIGERLAHRLRLKGLPAVSVGVAASGQPVSTALQSEAMRLGADLLVMGGYGHSRLRDFVLGGATSGVLDDLRMPVLMAH